MNINNKKASITKITRPKGSGVVLRERLFSLLDSGRKKPVIWITGPAGAGKTTLVASWIEKRKLPCLWYQVDEGDGDIASFFYYMGLAAKKDAPRHKKPMPLLTPEYLQGVPAFTRRYFEELFRRLRTPSTIVFDNFQDAPSAAFHGIISHGLEVVPEGINVIALSRSEPPAELSRLRANSKMAFIGWNELSFTLKECREFLKVKESSSLPDKTIRQLHGRTEGWAAGLVLMTEMAKTKEIQYSLISELSHEAVFNYFASEIFDKTGHETRDFLLKTSFFPSMSAAAAGQLTGNADAQTILSRLSRAHYFTDWRPLPTPAYQYHPLFREFLQSHAKNVFNPEELNRIQRNTAAILEDEGRIEDSAALFVHAGDWDRLAGIILGNAGSLARQGRTGLLNEWISSLPGDIVHKSPWLLYWAGICRMPFGPAASRVFFEEAFELFQTQNDETGTFLAWGSAVDTFLHEWTNIDRIGFYIEWLKDRVSRGNVFPSPEIGALVAVSMTTAQIMMRTSHAEFQYWTDQSLSLTGAIKDINLRLRAGVNTVQFYVLTGDFTKARVAAGDLAKNAKSPEASPFMKVIAAGMVAFVRIITVELENVPLGVSDCIRLSEETGIHICDDMIFALAVHASLNNGDMPAATGFLEKMKSVIRDGENGKLFLYHMLVSRYLLLCRNAAEAHAHAELALNSVQILAGSCPESSLPEMFFSCYYALAHSAHAEHMNESTDRYLSLAEKAARRAESLILDYMILIARAHFSFESGQQREGVSHLRKAMTLGRKAGIYRHVLVVAAVRHVPSVRCCA